MATAQQQLAEVYKALQKLHDYQGEPVRIIDVFSNNRISDDTKRSCFQALVDAGVLEKIPPSNAPPGKPYRYKLLVDLHSLSYGRLSEALWPPSEGLKGLPPDASPSDNIINDDDLEVSAPEDEPADAEEVYEREFAVASDAEPKQLDEATELLGKIAESLSTLSTFVGHSYIEMKARLEAIEFRIQRLEKVWDIKDDPGRTDSAVQGGGGEAKREGEG